MSLRYERLADTLVKPAVAIKQVIGSGVLIEDSKAVLYGSFKAGKSTLIQNIAMSIAGGLPLFGMKEYPTQEGLVWTIQMEIPEKAYEKRLTKGTMLSQMPRVQQNIIHSTCWDFDLDNPATLDEFNNGLAQLKPSVVILDPIYKTYHGSDQDSEDVKRVTKILDSLISQHHFALIVASQARKQSFLAKMGKTDMGDEEIRGSTELPAWVDTIMGIRRDVANRRIVNFTLRHGDEDNFALVVDYDKQKGQYSFIEKRK